MRPDAALPARVAQAARALRCSEAHAVELFDASLDVGAALLQLESRVIGERRFAERRLPQARARLSMLLVHLEPLEQDVAQARLENWGSRAVRRMVVRSL